jgi:hypothetical protein
MPIQQPRQAYIIGYGFVPIYLAAVTILVLQGYENKTSIRRPCQFWENVLLLDNYASDFNGF